MGVHEPVPQMFVPPPPHVCPVGQLVPQTVTSPQPFGIVPQLRPPQNCCVGQPHACCIPPPPHVSPVGHVIPQSIIDPQLSGMTPHWESHTAGTQSLRSTPARSNIVVSGIFQQRLSDEWQ
jgi:hypothetical protein